MLRPDNSLQATALMDCNLSSNIKYTGSWEEKILKKSFIASLCALFIIMICLVGYYDNYANAGCTSCEETDKNGWRIRDDLCAEDEVCREATNGKYYCFRVTSSTTIDATCGDDGEEESCFIGTCKLGL